MILNFQKCRAIKTLLELTELQQSTANGLDGVNGLNQLKLVEVVVVSQGPEDVTNLLSLMVGSLVEESTLREDKSIWHLAVSIIFSQSFKQKC